MGCWSDDLPPELLSLISTFLTKNSDYIRFRSVCVSKRRAASPQPRHLPPRPPLLIRPFTNNSAYRGFYSLSTGTTRWIHLPETLQKRCCGSSHGWLAFVDRSPAVFLFNPLTRARIDLPDFVVDNYPVYTRLNMYSFRDRRVHERVCRSPRMRYGRIEKIVLSSSPHAGVPWTAVALLGSTDDIMLWRPGDANWTVIVRRSGIYDIASYGGLIYSIDWTGTVKAVDADPSADAKETTVLHGLAGTIEWCKIYLVEFGSELLLAVRLLYACPGLPHYKTRFDVYKLDSKGECAIVNSLGDRALFLGKNDSFSFSSADFLGCSGNCTYFTDGVPGGLLGRLARVQSGKSEDGSVRPLPCSPIAPWLRTPPVWITPNLC